MVVYRSIFLILLLISAAAESQTRYVTDEVVITLRTGPSTQNTIVDNLNSGDRVEVLEDDRDKGYARVRVAGSGDEGWVLSRFLVAAPTAALDLADARNQLDTANATVASLREQVDTLTSELSAAKAKLEQFETDNSQLSKDLSDIRSVSANAIELNDQNESLRRRNNSLSQEVDELTARAAMLARRSNQNWFIVGALVLAGGIVVGLVAPSLRRKRRSSW